MAAGPVSPSDAAQAVNLLNVSIMAKHLLLQGKCQYLSVRRHTKHLAEGQKKIYSKIYREKKALLLSFSRFGL